MSNRKMRRKEDKEIRGRDFIFEVDYILKARYFPFQKNKRISCGQSVENAYRP